MDLQMTMTWATEITASLIAVLVIYVSHKVMKMYWSRRRLPPGPFPLPFIGNLLLFRQKNKFPHEILEDLSTLYGPVYTLFLGSWPAVIVIDPVIGLESLRKVQFAGRPEFPATEWLFAPDSIDVALGDHSKEWESLKKVAHSAIRLYASSPNQAVITVSAVNRLIARVGENSFTAADQFANLMTAITAEAAFGKRYAFDDHEFLNVKQMLEVNNSGAMIIVIPMLRFVFRQMWKTFVTKNEERKEFIKQIYEKSLQSHGRGDDLTFIDAVITAQHGAEKEDKSIKQYLKPDNMCNIIADLLAAGDGASRSALGWIFIMMCRYPEMQDKMRHEVESVIGDREEANIGHRENCQYISAFMSETLRFRVDNPNAIPHKTTADTEINGYKIKADTMVIFSLYNMLYYEEEWKDAKSFNPERFLMNDGSFNPKPSAYFVPFSDGRRSCPGNKLAFNTIFLIVATFLQKTTSISVVGGVTEDHMRGDMELSALWMPIAHEVKLVLKH